MITGTSLNLPIIIKSSEDFDAVHKVVLDGISNNMTYLVHLVKYGAINAEDPNKMGYYVIKYPYAHFVVHM